MVHTNVERLINTAGEAWIVVYMYSKFIDGKENRFNIPTIKVRLNAYEKISNSDKLNFLKDFIPEHSRYNKLGVTDAELTDMKNELLKKLGNIKQIRLSSHICFERFSLKDLSFTIDILNNTLIECFQEEGIEINENDIEITKVSEGSIIIDIIIKALKNLAASVIKSLSQKIIDNIIEKIFKNNIHIEINININNSDDKKE